MIRYLSKTNSKLLRGVALLRLDFNTEDDWRMKASIPTVRFLLRRASKVVIMSHRGRPGGFQKSLTLKKDAVRLEKLLRKKVVFIPHFRFSAIKKEIVAAPNGSVFVLENLRFMKGEEKNDKTFARKLARLGDFYVNDAFAVSHRTNASVAAIVRFLPSYGGQGLESEISNLSKVMRAPRKPLVIVLGGAKISDKLGVIKNFKSRANAFLLGGALANTLIAARGIDTGKSVVEKKITKEVRTLASYKKIILPVDVRVKNKIWLDIGPKTERLFIKNVRSARTIIWSGPMGFFEKKNFEKGTRAIGAAIAANKKAFRVVGGGETIAALKKFKLDSQMSFVSTGGGAMLEFLSGEKLPGIAALEKGRASPRKSRREALKKS